MSTPSLNDSILAALAGSTSQMPVDLNVLKSMIVPKVKLAELTMELGAMCKARQLQCCNGIKDGKAYVCYWMTGNLPPAWGKPVKAAAATAKPASKQKN